MSRRIVIEPAKKPPRDRTHKPKPRNAYDTIDTRVVPALLQFWRPRGLVWENAVGKGHMAEQLKAAGIDVAACSDIKDYGYPGTVEADFLKMSTPLIGVYFDIVTNPPNDKNDAFMRHGLELLRPHAGSMAIFQRYEIDCSLEKRGDLMRHPAFAMKIVPPFRPYWFKRKKKEKGDNPFHRFAWYIFDWRHRGPATIRYAE